MAITYMGSWLRPTLTTDNLERLGRIRKGTNGVSTDGVTANFVFLTEVLVWGTNLSKSDKLL